MLFALTEAVNLESSMAGYEYLLQNSNGFFQIFLHQPPTLVEDKENRQTLGAPYA
jgi:hypothetical protein